MNKVMIFCQTRDGALSEVGLELLTKGRRLAAETGGELEALIIGGRTAHLAEEAFRYGAAKVFCAEDERLKDYLTLPYVRIAKHVVEAEQPDIFLAGATSVGRDMAPRLAAELGCGLTADCTALELGDCSYRGNEYKGVLKCIRPSFVANQLTTIISPSTRPQMATIREGVMAKEPLGKPVQGKCIMVDTTALLKKEDFAVSIIEKTARERGVDLKSAKVIVAGGYGMGSAENFEVLFRLAEMLGGEVGATRAAIDAGYVRGYERMIGQTGITVRPKLYIACGISGQVQHTVGMDKSACIISINCDADAPIHRIADYAIVGDAVKTVEHMIALIKNNRR